MKSQTIEITQTEAYENSIDVAWIGRLDNSLQQGIKAAYALLPAVALVIATAWVAAQPGWVVYLQAGIWAIGFLFLGLTLDSRTIGKAGLNALAGLAMFILAWQSRNFGTELLIVAATVMGAWIAAAIFSGAKWPTSEPRSEDS